MDLTVQLNNKNNTDGAPPSPLSHAPLQNESVKGREYMTPTSQNTNYNFSLFFLLLLTSAAPLMYKTHLTRQFKSKAAKASLSKRRQGGFN